jgi:ectoine hydroxylase-related dioxygenase (phytanoyl-CoA dioxygenase family)
MLLKSKNVLITTEQLNFYKKNGYLIISNFISPFKLDQLNARYTALRKNLARQSFLLELDYENEISQVRDIWKYDKYFEKLILEDEIAHTVPLFFNEGSCRLLHDHIINKPIGNNGVIPWHQDYTYWPIDNPNGLSFWLPFSDLGSTSGVLEVIPKSHTFGEEQPIDFMNDVKYFSPNEIKYLTVKKGDLVVLDALTWHRTSMNTSTITRNAYISLWIPTNSRYAPEHASWHPVNDNIKVKNGEILNEDWFPVIGKNVFESVLHKYVDNSGTEKMEKITMFNASKVAKKFLIKNLDMKEDLWKYLYSKKNRSFAVNTLVSKFQLKGQDVVELNKVLLSMAINGIAYQSHRGRNVYNSAYIKFKKIFKNEI